MRSIVINAVLPGIDDGPPFVSAEVDDLTVQWRTFPGQTGWRCEEHGLSRCEHARYIEVFISREMQKKMGDLAGLAAGMTPWSGE